MSRALSQTGLELLYSVFGADTDAELSHCLSWCLGILIGVELVSGVRSPTPYGKTGPGVGGVGWNYPLSPRFVWKVGFLPWLGVPLALLFVSPPTHLALGNCLVLAAYYLHYLNRSLFYSGRISLQASRVPCWFLGALLLGTAFNSFYQTHHLLYVLSPGRGVDLILLLGLLIAALGAWINMEHDRILAELRGKDGGGGYGIPRGQLFEYVSCANYTGEVMEFWGLALATGATPQVLMATLTTVFLGLRARHVHNFYGREFKSYPKRRKALIPFLF